MKDLRKLFGTDGIRGIANIDLTPEFVLKVGKAGAKFLWPTKNTNKKILVGRDTRPSGDFISNAIISGVLSSGVDVLNAGILTTPAVALLIKILNLDGGIVISASHNPVEDNGIKFFTKGGKKLTDIQEKTIEDYIIAEESNAKLSNNKTGNSVVDTSAINNLPAAAKVGRIYSLEDANELYLKYLRDIFKIDLSGFKIAIDCANGASSILAPLVFKIFGAEVIAFNCDISGELINKDCGATHPDFISHVTLEVNADMGFAFDGDADRVMACDRQGRILDGDIMIGFCAIDMLKKHTLKNNCVVTTVMANMGFDKILSQKGIVIYKTDVGDRYVLEKMDEIGAALGGEQSGHIIFKDISPSGDGILSALEFLSAIISGKYDLNTISDLIPKFPQILKNVKVKDKKKIMESGMVKDAILKVSGILKDRGRLLVRPSGTEPLIRVMAEAETARLAQDAVAQVMEEILKADKEV